MSSILFKIVTIIIVALSSFNLYAEPSGRGYDPDAPDLGLPSGSEVGTGLLIAIIAIPIGYLLLKSSNDSNNNNVGGCLGLIFIGGGIICLLPLIAWICSIGQIIVSIGVTIVIIVVIFALIFGNKDK